MDMYTEYAEVAPVGHGRILSLDLGSWASDFGFDNGSGYWPNILAQYRTKKLVNMKSVSDTNR